MKISRKIVSICDFDFRFRYRSSHIDCCYIVMKVTFLLQDFLDELEGKAPNSPSVRTKVESSSATSATGNGNGGGSMKKKQRSSRARRSSMSDGAESLSRSGSDSSVSQQRRDSKNSDGGQHG